MSFLCSSSVCSTLLFEPQEASDRLEKLQTEQEGLSKKINKKVMGMFEKAEQEYQDLAKKKSILIKDKKKVSLSASFCLLAFFCFFFLRYFLFLSVYLAIFLYLPLSTPP
jgi:hypothetical protein